MSAAPGRAGVNGVGRLLQVAGAAGVAVSVVLPWVTVEGIPISLDLLGTDVAAIGMTVAGVDTAAWPVLVVLAGVVALLAVFNLARKVLVVLGALTAVAGAGLLYYLFNVIDIETSGRSAVERGVADLAVDSSVGAGPFVLLAGGLAILLGSLSR